MTATDVARSSRRALPVLLIAIFMAQFDFFVVNVAAPSIQHDLGAPSTGLQMIVDVRRNELRMDLFKCTDYLTECTA